MQSAKSGDRPASGGGARAFIAVGDYLEALGTQSKPLKGAMAELVAVSQTILIGCHEPGAAREIDLFMDALARVLPQLKQAGLDYVGVWANATLQGTVDKIAAAELQFGAGYDPLAHNRDRLECGASTETIIRTAKQAGLEVLLLKPPGVEIGEFDPQEHQSRVVFMAEKITARAAQKGLIFTFSADLSGTVYELPGGGSISPLASLLGKSGSLATLRLIYPEDRLDEIVRRLAPYLREKLPEGIYCVQNEYPISASGGMRPEKYQASHAVFAVSARD